jgi:hypothetical protein
MLELEHCLASSLGSVVMPNDEQLLAGCSIVAPGHIAQPAIADMKSFDDGQAERSRLLNDTTTHNKLYAAQPERRRGGLR